VAIELVVVTPAGEAYRGRVESVVLPGTEGDFGVLAGHERFLCPLRAGEVEIRTSEGSVWAAVSGGFADVSGTEVAVLAESCEVASDIDVARAELARRRAEEELSRLDADSDRDRYREFEAALERARTRLAVAQKAEELARNT
jgi:F-type H+-transporting ATPase subunit epsilon